MGSREHAFVQAPGTRNLSAGPRYRLWIDGVLDDNRFKALTAYRGFIAFEQRHQYALAAFSQRVDGMALREFLDPHVFVLQLDGRCEMLEINFNPTPKQVEALRRIYSAMRLEL